jgi:hypothetical protein
MLEGCIEQLEETGGVSTALPLVTAAENPNSRIRTLLRRFHAVALELRRRYDTRTPFTIKDEFDVQDLLRSLLRLFFEDIRPEEWTPSYAGRAARADFLLKQENIVIEAKKTREGLGAKEVGEQLIIDIARYKTHPNCRYLICFVYDPENRITNPAGLESDLSRTEPDFSVEVLIEPKPH